MLGGGLDGYIEIDGIFLMVIESDGNIVQDSLLYFVCINIITKSLCCDI